MVLHDLSDLLALLHLLSLLASFAGCSGFDYDFDWDFGSIRGFGAFDCWIVDAVGVGSGTDLVVDSTKRKLFG